MLYLIQKSDAQIEEKKKCFYQSTSFSKQAQQVVFFVQPLVLWISWTLELFEKLGHNFEYLLFCFTPITFQKNIDKLTRT